MKATISKAVYRLHLQAQLLVMFLTTSMWYFGLHAQATPAQSLGLTAVFGVVLVWWCLSASARLRVIGINPLWSWMLVLVPGCNVLMAAYLWVKDDPKEAK